MPVKSTESYYKLTSNRFNSSPTLKKTSEANYELFLSMLNIVCDFGKQLSDSLDECHGIADSLNAWAHLTNWSKEQITSDQTSKTEFKL